MMELGEFLALPTSDIASLVRQAGPQVCVFPINGTRRWFMLEHPNVTQAEYTRIATFESARVWELFFRHGIDTIISPLFGDELFSRGEAYSSEALNGALFLDTPKLKDFYKELGIRLFFYGNYRQILQGTPQASIIEAFDKLSLITKDHKEHRLFFGFFGTDATQATIHHSIEYYKNSGQTPDRQEMIQDYYGDRIEKATLFIGFERPTVFDYPLLSLGTESLYFTLAPSLYMDEDLLRRILYDHLYIRPMADPPWDSLSSKNKRSIRSYYKECRKVVLGTGTFDHGVWRPTR